MILAPAVAELEAYVAQRAIGAAPLILRRAPDWNRTAAAMIRAAAKIEIVFELVEVRQHFRTRPSCATLPRPLVEVGEHPANRYLSIDCRAAAHAPSAPIKHGLLHVGAPRLERAPLEFLQILRAENDRGGIRDAHSIGRLGRTVIGPGFE